MEGHLFISSQHLGFSLWIVASLVFTLKITLFFRLEWHGWYHSFQRRMNLFCYFIPLLTLATTSTPMLSTKASSMLSSSLISSVTSISSLKSNTKPILNGEGKMIQWQSKKILALQKLLHHNDHGEMQQFGPSFKTRRQLFGMVVFTFRVFY